MLTKTSLSVAFQLGDINGLKVSSQTFGQATSADFLSDDAFDGVLGKYALSMEVPVGY